MPDQKRRKKRNGDFAELEILGRRQKKRKRTKTEGQSLVLAFPWGGKDVGKVHRTRNAAAERGSRDLETSGRGYVERGVCLCGKSVTFRKMKVGASEQKKKKKWRSIMGRRLDPILGEGAIKEPIVAARGTKRPSGREEGRT